jgi:TolB protein
MKASLSLFILMALLSAGLLAAFVNPSLADGPGNATIGKITWAASRDGNWEIYTMNLDGTSPVRLTFDPRGGVADWHPVFTPDGSKIVWARSDTDFFGTVNNNIWIMNANGSGKTKLTNTGLDGHPFVANVSGIGLKIYFNRMATNGAMKIMRMNLDGTGEENLTGDDLSRFHPTVRESDGLIVYTVEVPPFDGLGAYIATFQPATGVEKIIYNPGWPVSAAAWKPDGSKIVLAERPNPSLFYRIVTINPDGTGRAVLTDGKLQDSTPYYIYPTGNKIVFARDVPDPSHRDIFIMNEDGTGQTDLTAGQPGKAGSADTFVLAQASCGPIPPVHPENITYVHSPWLPTIVTSLSSSHITLGGSITATVTINTTVFGTLPAATGTWTLYVANNTWMTGRAQIATGSVSGMPFKVTSAAWTSPSAGDYYFQAVYSGDTNYFGSSWSDPFTVHLVVSPPPVGGVVVPVDKFALLAPYIALASTILAATAATAIYVKHRKKKQ